MRQKINRSYMGFRCPDDVRIKIEELSRMSDQDMTAVILRLIKAGYPMEKAKYEHIGQILNNLNY